MVNGCNRQQKNAFLIISHSLAYIIIVHGTLFANVLLTSSIAPDYVLVGVMMLAGIHVSSRI
jgi:hypothetical protein